MTVFHNSFSPVGETSRSRFFQWVRRLGLGASGVPVGETSRSRCNRAARLPEARWQKALFIVGLGPSQVSTRAGERVSLAIARARALQRSRGQAPALR